MANKSKLTYGASSFYQGEAGRKYFEHQNRFSDAGGQLNAEKFQRFMNPGDIVLDFGCGGGWLLRNLKCGPKYGVELNSAAWNDCESNGIKVHASVGLLPEGLMFDRIISHHCLEHVPYPIVALRELGERLRATGEMLFVLPVDEWRTQLDFTGSDRDHHLHTWTPRLIANTFKEAGLQAIDVRILHHAWPPKWQTLHRLLPGQAFKMVCGFWSRVLKRRQLFVRAIKIAA